MRFSRILLHGAWGVIFLLTADEKVTRSNFFGKNEGDGTVHVTCTSMLQCELRFPPSWRAPPGAPQHEAFPFDPSPLTQVPPDDKAHM